MARPQVFWCSRRLGRTPKWRPSVGRSGGVGDPRRTWNVGDPATRQRGTSVGRGSPDPARGATAGLQVYLGWDDGRNGDLRSGVPAGSETRTERSRPPSGLHVRGFVSRRRRSFQFPLTLTSRRGHSVGRGSHDAARSAHACFRTGHLRRCHPPRPARVPLLLSYLHFVRGQLEFQIIFTRTLQSTETMLVGNYAIDQTIESQ